MKIITEQEEKYVGMTLNMSEDEKSKLVSYAHKNMSQEEKDDLFVNWAVVDILRKQTDSYERYKGKECGCVEDDGEGGCIIGGGGNRLDCADYKPSERGIK